MIKKSKMKYLKIATLLLCGVLTVSCSEDEATLNTSDATVNFQNTEMEVKETADLCNIPVEVTGERNGDIKVTISISSENAAEDENYIVTTKTLVISADEAVANFEFKPVDDEEINADRVLTIAITSVEGGQAGQKSSMTMKILDNDSNYYETLAGTWAFTGTASGTSVMNVQVGFSVKVNLAEEGTEAYGKYLVCSNEKGFDPEGDIEWTFNWRMRYEYDEAAQKIYVYIMQGEDVAANGSYTIRFRENASSVGYEGYRGEYDPATKTITFGGSTLIGDLYKDGKVATMKFNVRKCTMERIK